MKIISLVNKKGGCQKTTTAKALLYLLRQKGYKCLGVDLDSQSNFTSCFCTESKYTLFDFFNGSKKLEEVIDQDFLSSDITLDHVNNILYGKIGSEQVLKKALQAPCFQKYDYIIIDTPPAINLLTINALVASSSVIIPLSPNGDNLGGLAQMVQAITDVKSYYNEALQITGFLLTRYTGRLILHRQIKEQLEELAKGLNTKVFNTTIGNYLTSFDEAQTLNRTIFEYAPNSKGAIEYEQLIQEILES